MVPGVLELDVEATPLPDAPALAAAAA